MLLKNKVAVVTGAASGIGAGIAKLFAVEGAKVFLLDRDRNRNERTASSLPGFSRAITCDIRNRSEIQHSIEAVIGESGQIDIIINNAGIYPRQPFLQISEQQWDAIHDINLKGTFHVCQLVLPHMVSRRAGKVVNISSVTFHLGMSHLSHYVASKGGVIGFTRSLAREMGEHGICINCISAGAVLVDAEREVATDEQIQAIVEAQSIKRRILPIDIARVCLFLSSELSDAITGQTINVDGGWVMR